MTSSLGRVPLWTTAHEVRKVVDPATLGDHVVHYSIPSLDEFGAGKVEEVDSIKSAKLSLHGGEVLISKLNPRKSRVIYINRDQLPIVASTEFVALLPLPGIDSRFLTYTLGSESARQELDSRVQSVTRSHQRVSPEDVTHLSIWAPDIEEQRRIVDFLDAEVSRMGKLAKVRKKQLSLLWERLDAVAKEATGRAALHANADYTPTKLRRAITMIRTGTTPSHLEDVGSDNSPNTLPWYTPAALDGVLQVSPAEKKARDDGYVPAFPAGSILVTGIGESLGKIGYLTHAATGNQQLTALFPTSTTNGRFLAWQLHVARDELRNWTQYSRVRIINNDTLADFHISLPAKSVQDKVVARLDEHLAKVRSLDAVTDGFIAAIRERQRALITAAVTGQFDVSTASGRGVME
ncbi:restriction endonuclease subunit S [Actinomadura sp. 7K507]|uniref:restriction endonuclease subunit S n=1 Tax=Actinomadura sp. 7K507 TaxID=2530365 RepID=UPI00104846CE|nr:restriction endonuclease subunit S [Actinomadura sp. 7K507]TDC85128.1 restriction endonuclease subunit S [Actinomadura sp. 7K507]